MNVAARIRASLGRPLNVEGLALSPLSKIGIAIGPIHGKSTEELLRAADVASDLARHTQPPVVVYRVETDIHSESRLELLTRLRRALDDETLEVWFQPKVDAISGLVVGAEALLRWQDQERWIPPDLFIPAAEAAGMMNELTDFVVRRSLAAVAKWKANGHSLGVAVNLSPSSLEDSDLPARIAGELRRFQIHPPSLTIEITESVVMGLGQTVAEGLSRLRSLGVRISVDDFGTGYSSLRYLKDLDIDELKLDRSFVQDLSVSDRSATIARAVIGLGHSLGLQVVAEGVETVEARDLLNEMSCDVLQGFLVARPMDETKLARWLDRHQTKQTRPDRSVRITKTGPAK
ncbi:MAG: EAL domain-containing protein [Acidimicrobiales bacterium]|nr:EAL domain-containing protein [Acidimicrobiales bacterium]